MPIYCNDCLDQLPHLDENSIDACVTDPPYGLSFMGKNWDHGVPGVPFWHEVYDVLKPGAHLLAFGGTRTYHRLVVAIEDAGFEIRDCLLWVYGSGFPKSQNVANAIDTKQTQKTKRGKGERVTTNAMGTGLKNRCKQCGKPFFSGNPCVCPKPKAVTEAGKQWEGWGTALKPSCEPIVLARKPLSERTVAANVLKWGVGAINIDGCRVEGEPTHGNGVSQSNDPATAFGDMGTKRVGVPNIINTQGRWPANLIHDGSEEVLAGFPDTTSGKLITKSKARAWSDKAGTQKWNGASGDFGSAARFFYCAKANKKERVGSKHPTVKPINLLRYLCRLITPPNGVILDPFAGSGTTGEAALLEGFKYVLIEREREYVEDCKVRLRRALKLVR